MLAIVDFETCGLPKNGQPPDKQPGITQIGVMFIDQDFNYVSELSEYIDPEMEIEEAAAKITGIDRAFLLDKGAKPLTYHLPALCSDMRSAHTWVGFNNIFDRTILWYQLARYDWAWRFPWPTNDIDVMKIGKDICNLPGKQGVKPPKLVELHQHLFGEGFESAHDAMNDVRATHRCLQEIKKRDLM